MLRDARFLNRFLNSNKLPATKIKDSKNEHPYKRLALLILTGFYKMILQSTYSNSYFIFFYSLTCMFFFLNFLAATQDIAVDGWALTMLKRENVGYASTCNSVGQTAGYFMGYVRTHYMFSRIFNFLQRVLA